MADVKGENPPPEPLGQNFANELFPLPFTPFEHYLMLEDTLQRPMNSFIEMHFSTPLDVDTLRRSLHTAVHRHPLFASRAVRHGTSWEWHYDPAVTPHLCLTNTLDIALENRLDRLDIEKSCGVRFWYVDTSAEYVILVQIHHACSDGVGVRRMLIDVLSAYAQSRSEARTQIKIDKIDPQFLRERFIFTKDSSPLRSSVTSWQRLRNTKYFLFDTPEPIHAPRGREHLKDGDDGARQCARHLILKRSVSEAITRRAQAEQVGLNDLALALLFHVACQWNSEFGRTRSGNRLRILMPYDLRGLRADLRMPAANRMSFAFLGRTYAQCANWPKLLQSVQMETAAIKATNLPFDFLSVLQAVKKHPRLMKWLVNHCQRMASVVLTYAGDVSRGVDRYFPEEDNQRVIGDARLTSILGVPPVRVNTRLSLGLCINWGQLCISSAWDRQELSAGDCDLFLRRYAQAWTDWEATGNCSR